MKIVVDMMGADLGVLPIIEGVSKALANKAFEPVLVGDAKQAKAFISKDLASKVEVIDCPDFIRMDEQATDALKRKESSIFVGMDILKNGADALVSAGHSGATMGLATLKLGRIRGVSRPALCTLMPSVGKRASLCLDVGANTDCKAEYLLDFAILGYEYAKSVLGYDSPTVGLLANGEEDSKGDSLTKEAFKLINQYPLFAPPKEGTPIFKGNVEGNDIFVNSVDVVVCDGFVGNIVLKTTEGVASAIGNIFKTTIKEHFSAKIGAFLLKEAFGMLKQKTDYAEYGGAPLLGVNKAVIISHGKSNARAIECAIYQAIKTKESGVAEKMARAFSHKTPTEPTASN
ncbi:phosphate acyltransferase PlsX [Helicobacter ailurogastricus]|uniref:Phosphate acyltransferase n=1 Tax=Helicobacter ailurogastricus TaxID=1578720 RepID=A0A0K2X438_9HELI|nr:phosphate acyltransferase PlsX [Helicobacter ailurogastricus]CRF41190.1 Phosphate:acyl-ACP acyltransferase PlsX [Helicobacter ailurogastricus]CRF41895.1 Phosphate:acyl-ACP acyltransferase PlsX [Helicobacter ailurogastricus]CRF43738.1 Phosphate:acyl-ACP acyltransferase PlsX [Helicobacter ailurogastricus]CRI32284.1 Phosphate:acyl-ACP acyltransferase PlsX [Helicobacter ailurogastricus]BDQ28759.1 phosphate acyltransferase [Helicobacter ailurogastricus]